MPVKTPITSPTVSSAEVDLFSVVVLDAYHGCEIDLTPMAGSDSFTFRMYTWNDVDGTSVLELTQQVPGPPIDKKLRFNPVSASHYKITGQKVAGTDRVFKLTRWV